MPSDAGFRVQIVVVASTHGCDGTLFAAAHRDQNDRQSIETPTQHCPQLAQACVVQTTVIHQQQSNVVGIVREVVALRHRQRQQTVVAPDLPHGLALRCLAVERHQQDLPRQSLCFHAFSWLLVRYRGRTHSSITGQAATLPQVQRSFPQWQAMPGIDPTNPLSISRASAC
jgi:hypothetical protein